MKIVTKIKQGQCSAMRCAKPAAFIHDGSVWGRPYGEQIPLCDEHSKQAPTEYKPEEPPAAKSPKSAIALPDNMESQLKQEETAAQTALREIEALPVTTDEELAFAAEILVDCKTAWSTLETQKKTATDPLNATIKTIRDWFRPAQDLYVKAESALKAKIAAYHRFKQEEKAAAMLAAQAVVATGTEQEIRAAVEAIPDLAPRVEGVSVRETWTYEIVDLSLLPREWMVPNHQALAEAAKQYKGELAIPGVRPVAKDIVAARTNS